MANGGLQTGVRDQSHDDKFVNAVILELQIQIRVGETAGTPMLRAHDITRVRLELSTDLAARCAVFERLPRPSCLLNWRKMMADSIAELVNMALRLRLARPCIAKQMGINSPLPVSCTYGAL